MQFKIFAHSESYIFLFHIIFRYCQRPILSIDGIVDFGTCIADGKIYYKEIAILNHGTKRGSFKIHQHSDFPFTIMPSEGVVYPGYSQPIRVRSLWQQKQQYRGFWHEC